MCVLFSETDERRGHNIVSGRAKIFLRVRSCDIFQRKPLSLLCSGTTPSTDHPIHSIKAQTTRRLCHMLSGSENVGAEFQKYMSTLQPRRDHLTPIAVSSILSIIKSYLSLPNFSLTHLRPILSKASHNEHMLSKPYSIPHDSSTCQTQSMFSYFPGFDNVISISLSCDLLS